MIVEGEMAVLALCIPYPATSLCDDSVSVLRSDATGRGGGGVAGCVPVDKDRVSRSAWGCYDIMDVTLLLFLTHGSQLTINWTPYTCVPPQPAASALPVPTYPSPQHQ